MFRMLHDEVGTGNFKKPVRSGQFDHMAIKTAQKSVSEVRIVPEAPLAPGIIIRPSVPLTGKINPVRMAEFVSHKVEIAVPCGRQRDEPHQLVQGHPPVHRQTLLLYVHMMVKVRSHEPQRQRFIPHQCLVMAFRIADAFFIHPSIG